MDNIQSGSANQDKKSKSLMDLGKISIYDCAFLFVGGKKKNKHTYLRAALGWEHMSLPKIKAVPSEGDSSPVQKQKTQDLAVSP